MNNFIIRPLSISDRSKDYLKLLKQLTTAHNMSQDAFINIFDQITMSGNTYIFIIEDTENKKIIGSGTVIIEQKFIHSGKKVGHIEDIVVDHEYRGHHIGQQIITYLVEFAKTQGCYKIILDCDPKLKGFYEKNGFMQKGIEMAMYF